MMSKQHFEALAEEIRFLQDDDQRKLVAEIIARVAEQFNPRFNKRKFFRHAGVSPYGCD